MGGYGAPTSDGYGVKRNTSAAAEKTITTVTISNFVFEPSVVTVSAGDTLVFVNKDGAPHTATANGFDTGRLGSGESASIPTMKGTVVVE